MGALSGRSGRGPLISSGGAMEAPEDVFRRFVVRISAAFTLVENTKGMAGFIVAVCSIDWMSSFYYGEESNGELYMKFVKKFLPQYRAAPLYHNLRCGLVHNFTDRGRGTSYDLREDRPQ